MNNRQEKVAEAFCEAIEKLASKPENLKNLESYLSHHFYIWFERYANTPEGITYELQGFADMDIE